VPPCCPRIFAMLASRSLRLATLIAGVVLVGCSAGAPVAGGTLLASRPVFLAGDFSLTDLSAGNDGTWWLLDGTQRLVAHFGADGSFLHSIGRRGAGPGEFEIPTAVGVSPSGDVVVVDVGLLRLSVFERPAREVASPEVRTFPLPGIVSEVLMGPGADFVTLVTEGLQGGRGPALSRVSLATGAQDSVRHIWEAAPALAPTKGYLGRFHAAAILSSGAVVLANTRSPKTWIVDGEKPATAWNLPPSPSALHWTSADAMALFRARSGRPSNPLVKLDSAAFLARTVGTLKPQIAGTRLFVTDHQDFLWSVRYDAGGPVLKRYNRDGTEVGSMALSSLPILLRKAPSGVVLVSETNEGAIQLVRVGAVDGPRSSSNQMTR
jgi:hypothetical protein